MMKAYGERIQRTIRSLRPKQENVVTTEGSQQQECPPFEKREGWGTHFVVVSRNAGKKISQSGSGWNGLISVLIPARLRSSFMSATAAFS